MAEEGASLSELAGLDEHLDGLSAKYSGRGPRVDSKSFCSEFCQLVEGFCELQGSPTPQLRVLCVAVCYFFRASSFLPPHCDHVHYTLSTLALSVFELLLFLDQKEFSQDTLQHLTYTFQECPVALARHPNIYLLQLKSLIQDGGPWSNKVLLAILSESDVPQSQVDGFLSSEAPVFLELRVRYLLWSGRGREAATLACRCAVHPSSRQRPFFLQVHLAWLCKMERTEQLHREVCALAEAEVLQVMCGMERREEGGVLLCLCRAALRRLLHTGNMHGLWQLVCVWGSLHRRQQTSRLELLEESRHLLQSATNVTAIFPFIRVVLDELGDMGLQFCVELCSRALRSGLVSDGGTRSLVYKTIASLLPRDLEVCRACALLVFFQERTLEAYRTVVRLYSLPDQEYHAETTPVGNHVRFDLLQVLKKGLFFDPEFWNVAAIRSNCLKLLNGKALRAAREEVPEEVPEESHCTKEAAVCPNAHQPLPPNATDPHRSEAKKRHKNGMVPKRTRLTQSPGESMLQKKNKRTQRTPLPRESGEFLRRSFWQTSKTNDGFSSSPGHGEQRRITRFSEKNRPKRRIRTPRWLLEDSGTLEEAAHRKVKKLQRKRQQKEAQEKAQPLVKRNTSTLPKTSTKEKRLVRCDLAEKQSITRHLKGLSLDYLRPASPAHVILELSLPDNELSDIFTDESFSRRNGLPPVLLYKTSAWEPHPSQTKLKRVIIRASDEVSLAQQLHCYARRNKHLAVASEVQSMPSVVTRSSAQAPPTNGRRGQPHSKPLVEMKVTIASQTPVRTRASQSPLLDKGQGTRTKVAGEGSLPSDNKARLVVHRSPAADRKPTTNAVANTQLVAGGRSSKDSKENVGHDVGHSNACKDLATLQAGGVSDSVMTDAPAKDSNANLHTAVNDGRHRINYVAESVGHDVVTGRASDRHGSHVEEDLHGLMLLSETVSTLAPAACQSSTEAPGEAMEELSLPAQQSQILGNIPDPYSNTVAPSSSPGTEKSACSLSEPDSEEELVQEPEDQTSLRLEYRCTLCDKMFRGKRVVLHAMFHYRRDKCMFCGVLFKDDLLAMMHLSEHIDKLKKLKELEHKGLAGNIPQRSTELQATNPLPVARGRGRPRKSLTTPPPAVLDTAASESRRLRSDSNVSKGSTTPLPRPKVNGHIKRIPTGNRQHKAAASRLVPDQNGPSLPVEKEDKQAKIDSGLCDPPRLPKPNAKRQEAVSAVTMETCCPVVGCHWHADLSRSPLVLLYHALEDHHRDDTPLELAFHMGNGQCSVCSRVLWSFQHYRHHVERHRLTPRHPCLHQGCKARFKTGMEMRRHTRKHSPLQASCCVPGCSELFICLWALNLHEREHYAIKDTKSAKTREAENCFHRKTGRTRQGSRSAHAFTTPTKGKGRLEVREQTTDLPSAGDAQTDPRTEVTTVGELGKERSKLGRPQESKRIEGVQVPFIFPADSHSTVSHKVRKTCLRQRAKQTHLHLLSTKLSKIASGKKSPRKRRCGRIVEEEQSLDQNFTVASTSQEQFAPMVSTAQEHSAPMASTAQQHSAPMASTAQEHSAPMASTAQQHSAPMASKAQEQSAPMVSTAQEHSAPMASTAQQHSAPMASTAQQHSSPMASIAQQHYAAMASTAQEQTGPTMASIAQEQSAHMASTAQEQSSPTMASTAQEQSAPMVSTVQEQSAPLASTAQEQSVSMVSTAQEQSAPLAFTAQERCVPMVSTAQEQSAPMVSTTQEQSAPMASTAQEQTGPTMASTAQEQSAPIVSTAKEQSVPMASTAQEHSAPPMASTAHEQLKSQVSKKHTHISTTLSNSNGNMEKKVKVAHAKSGPKTTKTTTTGTTSKSKCKTPSKIKNRTFTKTTKGPSVAKTTKGPSVAKTAKGLSVTKTTKGPSVAKTTKGPSVAKTTKGPSVANITKGPSVTKASKISQVGKATEVTAAVTTTDVPPVAKTTEVTAFKTTEVPQAANVGHIGEVKQSVASDRVGYTVLVNGVAVGKRKAPVEAPGQAQPKEAAPLSYRKTYFRAPPTTYLDERFTNMPKRRKHMFRSTPPKSPALPPRPTTRCANCFVSFSHEEDLQTHLGDKKCSSMFGFDSDEDNS